MVRLKEKAFWITAGDIAGRGFSFAASIYLARTLGSELFGLITVAISIIGYATWFSDLGLNNIGIREAAKQPEKRIYRLIEIFSMKVGLGIVAIFLASIIISFLQINATDKFVLLAYLFSIIPYMVLMEWFFAGRQEFGIIAISKFLNGAIYFAFVVLLVNSMSDVILVPVFYTAGVGAASLFLGIFAIRKKAFSLPWRGIGIFPELFKSSSILGIGTFFSRIVQLLPALLIGSFLSFHDAGLYGAAFRIVLIAMLADRIFVNLLLPNLAAQWSENKKTLATNINTVFRSITISGTLIALFMAISAEQVIDLFYGEVYSESTLLLQILSILVAFTFINSLFSFGLIATNHDKEYFLATSVGGILSALIITISALIGSVLMVTVAVAISETIITYFTFSRFKKVIPLDYIKPVLFSFSIAVFLFFVMTFIPLMPIFKALIAAALFLLIVFGANILDKEQRFWLKEKILS